MHWPEYCTDWNSHSGLGINTTFVNISYLTYVLNVKAQMREPMITPIALATACLNSFGRGGGILSRGNVDSSCEEKIPLYLTLTLPRVFVNAVTSHVLARTCCKYPQNLEFKKMPRPEAYSITIFVKHDGMDRAVKTKLALWEIGIITV